MAYRETEKVRSRKRTVREAILRAARHRIAAGGYAAAQIQAVAEDAGIATGTVYRYFASKAELCAEVFRTVVRHEVDAVDAAAHGRGTPSQRLRAVVETFTNRALRAPRLAYALLAEPVDPLVEAERLLFRHSYARLIRDVVADGVAAGEFAPQDPDLAAAALVGALNETLVGPLSPTPKRPYSEYDYLPHDADTRDLVSGLTGFCLRAVTAGGNAT
jgi:AcrR family transcriptional regulator